MKQTVLCTALTLLAVPIFAANGIVIALKTTANGVATTNQIQFDANHMRAEMAGRTGEQNAFVFDGLKQVMYMIDNNRKTYTELSKADVDRMAAQVKDAMASIPPEQRARMEAMMRGRGMSGMPGMPAPPAKPTYKKTGTDKVGKWTCDKYEGYQGDRKTSELCTVDPKALGLTAGDFAVTKEFANFFSAILPQQSNEIFSIGSLEDRGFVGVPVRTIRYGADGSVQSTSELSDISHQNIPDSTFAPPAGFQKQDTGLGRRGRQ